MREERVLCRVPGCGRLQLAESRTAALSRVAAVCDLHREAEVTEIPSQPGHPRLLVRFCQSCLQLEPIESFDGSQKSCRRTSSPEQAGPSRSRILAQSLTRLSNLNTRRALSHGRRHLATRLAEEHANVGTSRANAHVPGQGLVAFLAGKTLASKVSIPTFYSAALWGLGREEHLAWVALGTTALSMHLLLPFLYDKCYLKPMHNVRKLAARRHLLVTPAFRLTNPYQQQRFEQMSTDRSSGGFVRDSLVLVGVISVYCVPIMDTLMDNGWGSWSVAPLTIGVLLFVPLRAIEVRRGQYSRRQWVDMAADLYCNAMRWCLWICQICPPAPHVIKAKANMDCVVASLCLCLTSIRALVKVLAQEKGLRWAIPCEVLTIAFGALIGVPAAMKCSVKVGVDIPGAGLMPYVASAFYIVEAVLFVARRSYVEAHHLQAFLCTIKERFAMRPHLHMRVKLRNATPADLPADLREQVLSLAEVDVDSIQGFIRPGCVLLTVNYRFPDSGTMEAGQEAILRNLRQHCVPQGLPWQQVDATLHIADTRFTVKGGEVVKEEAVLSPMIIALDPLVVFDTEVVTLQVMGLGDSPFTVLLLTGGDYVELQTVSQGVCGEDMKEISVRLPEFPMPGMAWIEIQRNDNDACPVPSNLFPIMFTLKKMLAEELSASLMDKLSTIHQIGSFLEDVARYLDEDSPMVSLNSQPAPPSLVLEAAQQGLPECFRYLSFSREALEAADNESPGLLSAAVTSGSEAMLKMVMFMFDVHSLPVEPCRILPDSQTGFSPLHLAAQHGSPAMIEALLAKIPEPEKQWHTLPAAMCGRTPAQLRDEVDPQFCLETCLHNHLLHQGQAVWGVQVIRELSLGSTTSKVAFPTLYALSLWAMGWAELLAWLVLAAACLVLHVLAPYVHEHHYVQPLARARGAAESCHVLVSKSLRVLDLEVQRAYDQFELQRSLQHPLEDHLIFLASVLLGVVPPLLQSLKEIGKVELWMVVYAVVAVAMPAALRWWAVYVAGSLRLKRWLDLVAWIYTALPLPLCHAYRWAFKAPMFAAPPEITIPAASALRFFVLSAVYFCGLTPGGVTMVPGTPLRTLGVGTPLGTAVLYFLGSTLNRWWGKFLATLTTAHLVGHGAVALWLVGAVFFAGLKVRSEASCLSKFLASHAAKILKSQQ